MIALLAFSQITSQSAFAVFTIGGVIEALRLDHAHLLKLLAATNSAATSTNCHTVNHSAVPEPCGLDESR